MEDFGKEQIKRIGMICLKMVLRMPIKSAKVADGVLKSMTGQSLLCMSCIRSETYNLLKSGFLFINYLLNPGNMMTSSKSSVQSRSYRTKRCNSRINLGANNG